MFLYVHKHPIVYMWRLEKNMISRDLNQVGRLDSRHFSSLKYLADLSYFLRKGLIKCSGRSGIFNPVDSASLVAEVSGLSCQE